MQAKNCHKVQEINIYIKSINKAKDYNTWKLDIYLNWLNLTSHVQIKLQENVPQFSDSTTIESKEHNWTEIIKKKKKLIVIAPISLSK